MVLPEKVVLTTVASPSILSSVDAPLEGAPTVMGAPTTEHAKQPWKNLEVPVIPLISSAEIPLIFFVIYFYCDLL